MDNEYIIDLTGVDSRQELHDKIAEGLSAPEWYGRNLDALYDILTEPAYGGDCRISFTGCADLRDSMPRYYAAMKHMCSAACEENPGLTITFEE